MEGYLMSHLTNLHPVKCLDCLRQIAAGRGIAYGKRYLCPRCAETRERVTVADRYRRAVAAMIADASDRWLINGMLWRLIGKAGFSAPLVLQAVADRAAWLAPATYVGVCQIAFEETRALGLDIQVG